MTQDESIREPASAQGESPWLWRAPQFFVFGVAVYFVARFGGYWAENDSAVFAQVIRVFAEQGRLIPVNAEIYANGYTYPALATFVVGLTGLDVATLQQLVFPLLTIVVVLPAWLLFRELCGNARGAALATMLLFTQPEFLFVVLRSSHEKFTRALMLFCLFLLVRSFSLRDKPRLFALYAGLFYVPAFALAASNNLLANSFFLALALSIVFGWLMDLIARLLLNRQAGEMERNRTVARRLLYLTLSCVGLVAIVTFYIYPPSQYNFTVLKAIWSDGEAVVLNTESQTIHNAYSVIGSSWIDPRIYFLVSIANWIALLLSFVLWAGQGVLWLRGKGALGRPMYRLTWLLYAAFAFQGVLSIVSDASGGSIGSNLQHRLFPSVSVVAVALVSIALTGWRPRRFTVPARLTFAAVMGSIALLTILKVTNEPAISNMWTFYRPYETLALHWSDNHLKDSAVWTEFNERLSVSLLMAGYRSVNNNQFVGFHRDVTTRNVLVSAVTRLRSRRLRDPLPVPPDASRVYDNGEAQLYHLRPETPHQR